MQGAFARLEIGEMVECARELCLALGERDRSLRHLLLAGRDRGYALVDVREPLLCRTHFGVAPFELRLRLPDRALAPLELAQLREARLELCLLARQLALRLRHRPLALGERSRLRAESGGGLGACAAPPPELLELRVDGTLSLRETRLAVREIRVLSRARGELLRLCLKCCFALLQTRLLLHELHGRARHLRLALRDRGHAIVDIRELLLGERELRLPLIELCLRLRDLLLAAVELLDPRQCFVELPLLSHDVALRLRKRTLALCDGGSLGLQLRRCLRASGVGFLQLLDLCLDRALPVCDPPLRIGER